MIDTELRFKAIQTILSREKINGVKSMPNKISDYYGSNVFNRSTMKEYLAEDVYKSVVHSIESGHKLDRSVADQVASSMKAWAISKGATHFTHWFQPLTGATAEKHDAFIIPTEDGKAVGG